MLTNPKRSHSAKAYNVFPYTQIFMLIQSVVRRIRKVGQTLAYTYGNIMNFKVGNGREGACI